MNSVEQIRKRMAAGEPIDGDLSWCQQRLKALQAWPEKLDECQESEVDTLVRWIERHASQA